MTKKRIIAGLLLTVALMFTGTSALTVTVCGSGCDNTTLTDAITYATDGDYINVSSDSLTGTYTVEENLTIYSDVNTYLDGGDSGVLMNIKSGGTGTTVRGFRFKNAGTFIIQLENSPNYVTIEENEFNMTGSASQGISVGAAGADHLTITNNDWNAMDSGDGAIWSPSIDNTEISYNTFAGGGQSSGFCIEVSGAGSTDIMGNVIDQCSLSIAVLNGDGSSNVDVLNNTVTNSKYGLYVTEYGAGSMSLLDAINNSFTDGQYGIRFADSAKIDPSGFNVYNNFIMNNSVAGLLHEDSQSLNASHNYWGGCNGYNWTFIEDLWTTTGVGDLVDNSTGGVVTLDPQYNIPSFPPYSVSLSDGVCESAYESGRFMNCYDPSCDPDSDRKLRDTEEDEDRGQVPVTVPVGLSAIPVQIGNAIGGIGSAILSFLQYVTTLQWLPA